MASATKLANVRLEKQTRKLERSVAMLAGIEPSNTIPPLSLQPRGKKG
jgi:hypothetical protein